MLVVTNNWRIWIAGMAVSLAIFGVVFFTVIKPSSDSANQAIKSGLQQSQQVINQAQKQLGSGSGTASSATGAADSTASSVAASAQTQLNNASKLTACLAQAGTDVTQVQTCQTKFGH